MTALGQTQIPVPPEAPNPMPSELPASGNSAGAASAAPALFTASPRRLGSHGFGVGRAASLHPPAMRRATIKFCRAAAPWLADIIGALSLFVLLFGALFLGEVLR